MDWNLFVLSFVTVFISELGDKSQIAAVALGGTSKFPLAVFLGTSSALVLTTFLGVVLGEGTAEILPAAWVKIAAACGFAFLGVKLLLNPGEEEETD